MNRDIYFVTEKGEIYEILKSFAPFFYDQSVNREESICRLSEKFSEFAKFAVLKDSKNELYGFYALYCNDVITKTGYLSMIIVREKYQGYGLGRMLLQSAIEQCKINKMSLIKLEVDKTNLKALSFYKKMGFENILEGEKSYIYMKKIL